MSDLNRRLVLIRHARAEDSAGRPDHDRPLTRSGRQDAREMGRWLKDRRLAPGAVLCSTAVRARETWENIADGGALGTLIEHDARIYNAGVPQLIQLIQEVDADTATVAVVGHAPGLPALADLVSEGQAGTQELAAGFPTCTAAVLQVGVPWSDLGPGAASVEVAHTARYSDD